MESGLDLPADVLVPICKPATNQVTIAATV
jgi:hypothetical protein